MYIQDNQNRFVGGYSLDNENYSKEALRHISQYTLKELIEKEDILVYPYSFEQGECNSRILHFEEAESGDKVYTGNMMGFIGTGDTDIFIYSRFDNPGYNYLLHYMLQRINSLSIFDLKASSEKDDIQNFLLYLFPKLLTEAVLKGVYKSYQQRECNDTNIKGRIDINRHIRMNTPFNGSIAYTIREYSADNPINQLIRHCIEYIKMHPIGKYLLNNNSEVKAAVSLICNVTNSYNQNDCHKILIKNQKVMLHPFYHKYRSLQKLSIAILSHKKYIYGEGENKIHGILFDGAWLWEEYVAKVISNSFKHYTRKSSFKLFKDGNGSLFQSIIPDYLSKDEPRIVADAKYISLDKSQGMNDERALAIYYKTIAYMHRFNSNCGLLLYPTRFNDKIEVYKIIETSSIIAKIGLNIADESNYKSFCAQMQRYEQDFLMGIQSVHHE